MYFLELGVISLHLDTVDLCLSIVLSFIVME